jgi:hypothetical protein
MSVLVQIFENDRNITLSHLSNALKKWAAKQDVKTLVADITVFIVEHVKTAPSPKSAFRVFCSISEIAIEKSALLKQSKWEKSVGLLLRACSQRDSGTFLSQKDCSLVYKVRRKAP